MNKKPIGIFDSGVGGLTVAREIMNLMPQESIVYLGDTANLPYGDKSGDIIKQYAITNTEFLLKSEIKVLVVACNTASAVALDYLKEKFDIPIIGVVEPAAKGAVYATRNKKVGVIGTNRTIKSDIYRKTLLELEGATEVYSRPCPLFVPLIEENFIDHEATRLIAHEYLREFQEKEIDSMILGCTHYPLIKNVLSEVLPDVKMIDSANSTAQDLLSVLNTHQMYSLSAEDGAKHRFYATDITDKLNHLAGRILEMEIQFEEVSLK